MAIDAEGNSLLNERYDSFEVDGNSLRALLPLQDSKRRKARCAWEFGGGCRRTEFTLLQPPEEDRVGLIAYAFFESVLIGADFTSFLSDGLIPDAERIRAFLGDFIAVTLTDEPTVCGIVRKKRERLFTVDCFSVEIQNGKIIDVKG